jgi:hypothetical protein
MFQPAAAYLQPMPAGGGQAVHWNGHKWVMWMQ